MREIKAAFDPKQPVQPGKIVPDKPVSVLIAYLRVKLESRNKASIYSHFGFLRQKTIPSSAISSNAMAAGDVLNRPKRCVLPS
jgi:hypothetical protein